MMQREEILEKIIINIGKPTRRLSCRCGNIRTNYLQAGSGSPVILVHGGDAGAGGVRWFPVIGPLASDFQVIVPDMAGYGESEKPVAVYDRPYFSNWLHMFVRSLGLDAVRIIGHSVGGAVVMQFAMEHPEVMHRMVLINAAGFGRGVLRVPLSMKLQMIWQNLFPSDSRSRAFLERYGLYDPGRLTQRMLDVEMYGNRVIRGAEGRRVFWLGRGRVIAPFTPEEMRRIACPTMILWGREDKHFPPLFAQSAAGMIAGAVVEYIPRAGHNCFYDQPEPVIGKIMEFMK
jgi:pimeloyl-ACP methyl ester carboxylesterase